MANISSLPASDYTPQVRDGNVMSIEGSLTQQLKAKTTSSSSSEDDAKPRASEQGSSWVQPLTEIPYEDSDNQSTRHAVGYIFNVPFREGLFESSISNHGAKNGRYVHTNKPKAALNMITETEATTTWKTQKIATNTVDPGYMSAAPEIMRASSGETPIGWEDRAGRVL
ncbi:hypothetical protein F5Y19DRAFT_488538 [Xylariaceae sp. FL1651]|nr:hypothetical protein F5Y19DRAFT_488538 [Xylariaceae sp. FL1651]